MQVHGTDITVTKGESFSIDYLLVNRDGSPYVLSNKAKNPYLLLTVASTKYLQEGRYVKNWWLEIPKEMLFYTTNTIEIAKAYVETNSSPDIDSGEYNDLSTYAIYYYVDEGNKIYKRWTGTEYVDYEFRVTKTFTKEDTFEWAAQSYVYSINYVDGESMHDYLSGLYISNKLPEPVPYSKELLYDSLVKYDAKYSSILYERELSRIDVTIPIVNISKLSVIDNIEGGII